MSVLDPTEHEFMDLFFGNDSLRKTLKVLCQSCANDSIHENTAQPQQAGGNSSGTSVFDPVTSTLIMCLTCKIQLMLVANGVQIFEGKRLLFPFQSMSVRQREFLIKLIGQQDLWRFHDHCLIYKKKVVFPMLDAGVVLQHFCSLVRNSKKYADERSQLTLMNIVLQRIHSNVAIPKTLQRNLNTFLFDNKGN
jgi:hypothetical protein